MTERKVIHLELKEPKEGEPRHQYFGSLTALFAAYTRERLGVSYRGITNNYDLRSEVYENKHCVIRGGTLATHKEQNYDQGRETKESDRSR